MTGRGRIPSSSADGSATAEVETCVPGFSVTVFGALGVHSGCPAPHFPRTQGGSQRGPGLPLDLLLSAPVQSLEGGVPLCLSPGILRGPFWLKRMGGGLVWGRGKRRIEGPAGENRASLGTPQGLGTFWPFLQNNPWRRACGLLSQSILREELREPLTLFVGEEV